MSQRATVSAAAIVDAHWGADAPQWVRQLAGLCDGSSQAAAARKISYSASLVNQVLKNRYMGDLTQVQLRVEAAAGERGRDCPVLGQIDGAECLRHQRAGYNPANHVAVRLYRACLLCPHNISKGKKP